MMNLDDGKIELEQLSQLGLEPSIKPRRMQQLADADHINTVYGWIKSKRLKAHQLPNGRFLIPVSEAKRFLGQ